MKFNGIEKDFVTVLKGRKRPYFESEYGREIIVPILIKHDGFSHYQKLKEEIAMWLKHEDPKPLQFNDDNDRLYFAKVENIEEGNTYNYSADAIITFLAHSKYSNERTIFIDAAKTETIVGHKSTQWKTKTTFSDNQTGYELQFHSPGKSNLRDIGKIKLNYEFVAGDVLEIDYAKRLVKLNGVDITNTVSILASNFMELPIGEVEFSSNHQTEFYYHERYY